MTSLADLQLALFKPARQIGPYTSSLLPANIPQIQPFTAQVTVRETHRDRLYITEHPVEQGGAITDHSFKRPAELIVEFGWSNSGFQSLITDLTAAVALLSGSGEGGFSYAQEIYNKLLTIQLTRVPLGIVTGKRSYSNMLIEELDTTTDQTTEHALIIRAYFKQVIIVQTQVVPFPDPSVQANPAATSATTSAGAKIPAVTSLNLNTTTFQAH